MRIKITYENNYSNTERECRNILLFIFWIDQLPDRIILILNFHP